LLSFLFRFGYPFIGEDSRDRFDSSDKNGTSAVTPLSQTSVLFSGGGEGNMSAVFKIDSIVALFGICFNRLCKRMQQLFQKEHFSLLNCIIDHSSLGAARDHALRNSQVLSHFNILRNDPGKITDGKRVGHVFSKRTHQGEDISNRKEACDTDDEAEELMAGYGLQRGPRGALIPRHRPDIEAKRTGTFLAVERARKNRKNNKKQSRDAAITEWALQMRN